MNFEPSRARQQALVGPDGELGAEWAGANLVGRQIYRWLRREKSSAPEREKEEGKREGSSLVSSASERLVCVQFSKLDGHQLAARGWPPYRATGTISRSGEEY